MLIYPGLVSGFGLYLLERPVSQIECVYGSMYLLKQTQRYINLGHHSYVVLVILTSLPHPHHHIRP